MLQKLLIANRGEIACRIARTARRLGIATVAVYSDADARALHVSEADAAARIGPAPAAESYLDADRILAAARETGCDAVHPGYGFLAENPAFAEACRAAGLIFVGPSPEAMRRLGDKMAAKVLAESLGISTVPGYDGKRQEAKTLVREAARIGYPVMIKAAAGGGGRGLRRVARAADFTDALESAVREATSAFGDGRVLLEKAVTAPRHIEVQVFADRHGNAVHLFERDCTLQRRHQKVVEEAPAPGMSEVLRTKLTDAALALARAAGYEGAGTMEFLVEGGGLGPEAPWYFIEANTRLQVEHPVTEAVTGLDLVEWQLRVAAGEPLPRRQDEIRLSGHAIEARLYAEDPAAGFRPSSGRVLAFRVGHGQAVRVDKALPDVAPGTDPADQPEVTPFYDSLIAKVIARGDDREGARQTVLHALADTLVLGPSTNLAFLAALLRLPAVAAGELDTELIDREIPNLVHAPSAETRDRVAAEFLRRRLGAPAPPTDEPEVVPSPWDATDAFQLGGTRSIRRSLLVDGERQSVELSWPLTAGDDSDIDGWADDGPRSLAQHRLLQIEVAFIDSAAATGADAADTGLLRAPLNGRLAKLYVRQGAHIAQGDRVAVIEAMKMEHVLHAGRAGTVARLPIPTGAQVSEGDIVAEIVADEEGE